MLLILLCDSQMLHGRARTDVGALEAIQLAFDTLYEFLGQHRVPFPHNQAARRFVAG